MELTLGQLKQMVHGIPHAEHWYEALDQLLPDYEITHPDVLLLLWHSAHTSRVDLCS